MLDSSAAVLNINDLDTEKYDNPVANYSHAMKKMVHEENNSSLHPITIIENSATSLLSSSETFELPEMPLLKNPSPLKGKFKLLQFWEGHINKIYGDIVTVTIKDKTDRSNPDEQLDLSINEFPPEDIKMLNIGAIFYWSIGYSDQPGIPRERVSRIRFQRLPVWTSYELNRAENRAREISTIISRD